MAEEELQFTDAASCKAWLSRLPRSSPSQCHAALAAQVRLLPAATIAPAGKLAVLEALREPVAESQAEMARNCRGKPVPLQTQDREAWDSVVGTWRAMASGYDALIDAMASTAPELAAQAHVICQRALRYTALAMFEHCHVYYAVNGALWQQLHRLYVFSENAGLAATTVDDAVGRRTATTTCAATYAHALLMHLAQPDALSGEELGIVDRWLERWESLVTLSPDPLAQVSIPALAVDLASTRGAGLAKNMPAAGVRHLNIENLGKALRQAAAGLKQQTPAQLGLGEVARNACEKLLLLLHVQWCAAGTGRVDERTPASIKVMISSSLASIHFHLTGKAFRQPGGELTAAERQRLDMFGSVSEAGEQALASQRSAAAETWVIVNQSVSGFLGTTTEKDVVNRISHGQLVGIQPAAKKVMYIGIVQRLIVDESGTIWIGLRIILGAPQAVSARIADGTAKYDRGLLMPEDAARRIPATILLLPGWHQANRILNLYADGDKARKIKLQALLDRGANFDRATYAGA
jgi:hypothetical protein